MSEIDPLERRVRAVESGLDKLGTAVADMKAEAHETRQEQTQMLKTIVAEVKLISDKQTFEAGRAAGAGEAHTQNISAAERRAKWFFPLIGSCILLGLYALENFIEDKAPREVSVEVTPRKVE